MTNCSIKDSLTGDSVDGAIRQAAKRVLETAKQTSTPVVIGEDDQIEGIPAEEMEMRMGDGYSAESRP